MNEYYLTCNECQKEWIGRPWDESFGGEKCPECGSTEFEIGKQYVPRASDYRQAFWVVLLVPNFLLFWC